MGPRSVSGRIVELLIVGVMVTIILLLTAKNPWDGDELIRGPIAGIVGCIIGWVFRGVIGGTLQKDENKDEIA